jgi:ABC-type nitrate/sulfonate/bicarbonate transport system ATPase subunit
MVARNDITGDSIQTKNTSSAYRDHYDNIFRKDKMQVRVQENVEDIGKCGCGRSPTGKCIGWHGLSEEAFQARLSEFKAQQEAENK